MRKKNCICIYVVLAMSLYACHNKFLFCSVLFTISSVDLAHYGVNPAKDLVYVDCGTK